MQKRSHKLLASALLRSQQGFEAKRFEWAFLFGSFQPDCNPLSYLKGSLQAKVFGGHNYTNSRHYIDTHIEKLRRRARWSVWQYYTLGKLTHYLADAFTYPHNEGFSASSLSHHQYETALRLYLADYLSRRTPQRAAACSDPAAAIMELHRQYADAAGNPRRDVRYILQATALLMAGCQPAIA